MTNTQRIEALENEILELKKIVQKDSLTFTDESNPNKTLRISLKNGVYSTDRITVETITTTENITKENY